MNLLLMNIIVLIFEVLYYALFMKFARKEGKFSRYVLLFTIITIILYIIGTNHVYSHLLLIFMMLLGLKYLTKTKVYLYDMLVIIIMLFISVIIQFPIYMIFINVFKNLFFVTLIYEIAKIIFVLLINKNMNLYYNKFHKIWDNNNFYIRYIFAICIFIYAIISCLFTIIFLV